VSCEAVVRWMSPPGWPPPWSLRPTIASWDESSMYTRAWQSLSPRRSPRSDPAARASGAAPAEASAERAGHHHEQECAQEGREHEGNNAPSRVDAELVVGAAEHPPAEEGAKDTDDHLYHDAGAMTHDTAGDDPRDQPQPHQAQCLFT